MHFSIAMESAFWLVRLAMLVGKCDGANDGSDYQRVPQGSMARFTARAGSRLAAETGPDEFRKPPAGNDFASNESYQIVKPLLEICT
jgi:hypothetical protein